MNIVITNSSYNTLPCFTPRYTLLVSFFFVRASRHLAFHIPPLTANSWEIYKFDCKKNGKFPFCFDLNHKMQTFIFIECIFYIKNDSRIVRRDQPQQSADHGACFFFFLSFYLFEKSRDVCAFNDSMVFPSPTWIKCRMAFEWPNNLI